MKDQIKDYCKVTTFQCVAFISTQVDIDKLLSRGLLVASILYTVIQAYYALKNKGEKK